MFKSHVKALMDAKGETFRSVAEKAEITQHSVLRARKDDEIERCTLAMLKRIANALGVGVKDLFSETEECKPHK